MLYSQLDPYKPQWLAGTVVLLRRKRREVRASPQALESKFAANNFTKSR